MHMVRLALHFLLIRVFQILTLSESLSGNQMYVIEIIAPWGHGTAANVVRWLKRNLLEK
jgi:hemolysin-activating ACP:hemolysin acyltransferase